MRRNVTSPNRIIIDQYIIAVGSWIDQNPEAIAAIIEEFDLPREKTIVQKASHWDIGQTWADNM